MNKKYFFIFLFLFSLGCSNIESSFKDQFKNFLDQKGSKIRNGLIGLMILVILTRKPFKKKKSPRNNFFPNNNQSSTNNFFSWKKNKLDKASLDVKYEYTDTNGNKVNLKSEFQRLYFVIIDYIIHTSYNHFKIKLDDLHNEFYFLKNRNDSTFQWKDITFIRNNQDEEDDFLPPLDTYKNKCGIITDNILNELSLFDAYKKYSVYNTLIVILDSKNISFDSIINTIKKFDNTMKNQIIYFVIPEKNHRAFNNAAGYDYMGLSEKLFQSINKNEIAYPFVFSYKKAQELANHHDFLKKIFRVALPKILINAFESDWKFIKDYKNKSNFEEINYKEEKLEVSKFYIQKEWHPDYYTIIDDSDEYFPFGLPYFKHVYNLAELTPPIIYITKDSYVNKNQILSSDEKNVLLDQATMLEYVNIVCGIKIEETANKQAKISTAIDYLEKLMKEIVVLLKENKIKSTPITIIPVITNQIADPLNANEQQKILAEVIKNLQEFFNPAPVPREAERVQPEAQPQPV